MKFHESSEKRETFLLTEWVLEKLEFHLLVVGKSCCESRKLEMVLFLLEPSSNPWAFNLVNFKKKKKVL